MRTSRSTTWSLAVALATSVVAIVAAAAPLHTSISGGDGVSAQRAPARAEGITVHGAWVIDVRNPDGSLAARREFTNDLVPNGGIELAKILARTNTVDTWNIILSGEAAPLVDDPQLLNSNDQPCFLLGIGFGAAGPTTTPFPCYLTETSQAMNFPGVVSSNLQFGTQTTGSGRMVVAGTITTGRAGFIRAVSTHFGAPLASAGLGAPVTSPALLRPFTRAVLQTPLQVTAGQLITVSVTYTFS